MPDFECITAHAESAVKILKALANKRRLLILCTLTHGEKCVGELEEMIGISQSALSQHLAKLRSDGLVSTRRDAQTIHYMVSSPAVTEMLQSLKNIFADTKN